MAGVIALLQLGLWLLLGAASVHLLRSAIWAWRRPLPAEDTGFDGPFPSVTVQIPLRNERDVAERALRAACALDWPGLEIQALDDSDDETVAIVDRTVHELRAAGHDVRVVRREGRAGYKAGALQNGLASARGELIAVLDADAQPPRDFLRRAVAPLVSDGGLGFAQARWGFENEEENLLTRVQALILDGLMLVEQPRLSALGRPVPFNGTGGVWRRAALEAAGGWFGSRDNSASVTEDLDLSYRARLAGFRGRTLPEVIVVTELPSTMAAFRAQQARWVRGGGEVLRALLRRLRGAPAGDRLTMLAHLLRHARQPWLLAMTLWLPLVTVGPAWGWPAVLALVHVAASAYYASARRRAGRSIVPAITLAPVVVALSVGLSLVLTVAFARGLLAGEGEFVRTPKRGDAARARYRAALDGLALVEILVGVTYTALSLSAWTRGEPWTAIGFATWLAGGWLWVGAGSLLRR